jgi:excisionase family DNA binding protein
MDGYLTVNEAAKKARVTPKTVYRWLDDGKLVKYRDGLDRVMVNEAELDERLTVRPVPAGAGGDGS